MTPEAQAQIINALIVHAPEILTALGGVVTTVLAYFHGLHKPQPVKRTKPTDAGR